jgi:hypothetical protein
MDDFIFQYEKVSIKDAAPKDVVNTEDFSPFRFSSNTKIEKINNTGKIWLATFPPDLNLDNLANNFPRIINKLAEDYPFRSKFKLLIDGYLIDDRGTRKGFSDDVIRDLIAIRDYFNSKK